MASDFDIEKNYEKLQKILALATGGSTEHERHAAAGLAADFLIRHPLPIRWFVPKGTHCRVVPAQFMTTGNLHTAQALIRTVQLHEDRWFKETERVRAAKMDGDRPDRDALRAGCFYFQQKGFALFIAVQHVTVAI